MHFENYLQPNNSDKQLQQQLSKIILLFLSLFFFSSMIIIRAKRETLFVRYINVQNYKKCIPHVLERITHSDRTEVEYKFRQRHFVKINFIFFIFYSLMNDSLD